MFYDNSNFRKTNEKPIVVSLSSKIDVKSDEIKTNPGFSIIFILTSTGWLDFEPSKRPIKESKTFLEKYSTRGFSNGIRQFHC